MDDLIPFLIFIAIALVNLVKSFLEKGKPKKNQPEGSPSRTSPNSIEEFFEEVAEKFQPKQTELPDWPEAYEKPNYLQEMKSVEQSAAVEDVKEAPYAPPMPQEPIQSPGIKHDPIQPSVTEFQATKKASFQSILSAENSAFKGLKGMHISTPPILRSEQAGAIDFSLKGKKKLKQALLANLIFSPPRAYDNSFNNTMAN